MHRNAKKRGIFQQLDRQFITTHKPADNWKIAFFCFSVGLRSIRWQFMDLLWIVKQPFKKHLSVAWNDFLNILV